MIVAVGAEEAKFRAQLVALLEGAGHRVAQLRALAGAQAALRAAKPSVFVAAFPLGSGIVDCLQSLRASADLRSLPVLCIDPAAGPSETVALLDAGADDAIARPFSPPIFLARVRTLLRRSAQAEAASEESVPALNSGPIELRLVSRQALVGGKVVELTRLEFDLLAHLLKHPGRAFKREELLAAVWNYPENVETRTLDKHVEALRRKVGPCAEFIATVHGVGYRFSPNSGASSIVTPGP